MGYLQPRKIDEDRRRRSFGFFVEGRLYLQKKRFLILLKEKRFGIHTDRRTGEIQDAAGILVWCEKTAWEKERLWITKSC